MSQNAEENWRPPPQTFARSFRRQMLVEFTDAGLRGFAGEFQVVVPQDQKPLGEGRVGHACGQEARASRLNPMASRRSRSMPRGPSVLTNSGAAAAVLLPSRAY